MDASQWFLGVPKGINFYSRVSLCLILGGFFILVSATGDRHLLDSILITAKVGYGTKLFSLVLVALVLGLTLNWVGRILFEIVGTLLMRFDWYKKTSLIG